jgi:hypothetical protein
MLLCGVLSSSCKPPHPRRCGPASLLASVDSLLGSSGEETSSQKEKGEKTNRAALDGRSGVNVPSSLKSAVFCPDALNRLYDGGSLFHQPQDRLVFSLVPASSGLFAGGIEKTHTWVSNALEFAQVGIFIGGDHPNLRGRYAFRGFCLGWPSSILCRMRHVVGRTRRVIRQGAFQNGCLVTRAVQVIVVRVVSSNGRRLSVGRRVRNCWRGRSKFLRFSFNRIVPFWSGPELVLRHKVVSLTYAVTELRNYPMCPSQS